MSKPVRDVTVAFTQENTRTPKITGKGQVYSINKFLGKKSDGAILAEQKAEREGKPTNSRKGSNK